MKRAFTNRAQKLFRLVLWVQATYILITATWPILDVESFMFVTGEKEDIWLVKTVGALLIPVAACLYSYVFIVSDHRPAIILGAGIAIAFTCIDVTYVAKGMISKVYLADAAAELIFLIAWMYILRLQTH